MRKSLICVVLLLTLGVCLGAQAYIYNPSNSPGTGSTNSWPFRSYTEWRFQFIVNASVLPNAPIKILDIAFSCQYTSVFTAKQFQIRMGHTTHKTFSGSGTTKFDDILGPCATICYNGPLKWAGTAGPVWSPIGLQAHFGYDGKRNICVEIRYMGGSANQRVYTDASIARAYTHTSYSPNPYNAVNWYVPIPGEMMGPKHRLEYDKRCILIAPDTAKLGLAVPINVINGPSLQFYQIAASLGQYPPINLVTCKIFLTVDSIFLYSVMSGPPVFFNYSGQLSASGTAIGRLVVPPIKQLVGLCVYHAALCYGKVGPICCTNTDGTLIVP